MREAPKEILAQDRGEAKIGGQLRYRGRQGEERLSALVV